MQNRPLDQKVGQLFFIGLPGTTLDGVAEALLEKIAPGGVCLFARNIKGPRQTRELLDAIRGRSTLMPFLSVDQEGGLVDRLRRIISPMPAANLISNSGEAARYGSLIGETLRTLGFNMDFAPVVDVISERRESVSNGLYSRGFGRDAEGTAEFAAAFLENLQAAGILGCVKHFPGLGASEVDSHEELPLVNINEDELFSTDLLPYRRMFDRNLVNAVMVAHAAFPNTGLQDKTRDGKLLPSSLSAAAVTGLLRTELKYDGLVITDDLEMGAIVRNFGVGEACVMAIEAGADMLAICADPERIAQGFDAVLDAVDSGRIDKPRLDVSLGRIETARALLSGPLPFDADRLAELSDTVARFGDELIGETVA